MFGVPGRKDYLNVYDTARQNAKGLTVDQLRRERATRMAQIEWSQQFLSAMAIFVAGIGVVLALGFSLAELLHSDLDSQLVYVALALFIALGFYLLADCLSSRSAEHQAAARAYMDALEDKEHADALEDQCRWFRRSRRKQH